jgi:hypothetical protein
LEPDPTKFNTKVKKQKLWGPTFWESLLLLALKRQDFVQIFCCCKTVHETVLNKFGSGTGTDAGKGTGAGTKIFPK